MITFRVGLVFVEIAFSWFALAAFCCLFAGGAVSAFLLSAVLIHELAHVVMLCFFHSPPRSLALSAMGCRLQKSPRHPLSNLQNAAVSISAPLCNLMCAAFLHEPLGWQHPFVAASLSLGLFHLLPVVPLDGGLALRSLLCCVLSGRTADRLTAVLSAVIVLPLGILGFLLLLSTRYNFSLLALSVYVMLYLLFGSDAD